MRNGELGVPIASFLGAVVLSLAGAPRGSGLALRTLQATTGVECVLSCSITEKPESPVAEKDAPKEITFKFKPTWMGDCEPVFATVSFIHPKGGGGAFPPEAVQKDVEVQKTLKLRGTTTVLVTLHSPKAAQSSLCSFTLVVGDAPPPSECALDLELTDVPAAVSVAAKKVAFNIVATWEGDCGEINVTITWTIVRGGAKVDGDAIFRRLGKNFNGAAFPAFFNPKAELKPGDVVQVTVTATSSDGGGQATKSFNAPVVP